MATKSKAIRSQFNDETEAGPEIGPATTSTKKPVFYMSVLPSHKSKAKYFTMMNNRVVVETMRNGVAGGDLSGEQERHFRYLKKRFPKYLVSSADMKPGTVDLNKQRELQDKIRKINETIGTADKKLANEMIADLKKKYSS